MPIAFLRITNFRNFTESEISPSVRGLNVLYGQNGSGKTSLLEAIHYLALGRSFRHPSAAKLIRSSTNKFSIFSHIVGEFERDIPVGVERHIQGCSKLRIAEQDVSSIAELAAFLPVRLINAQSHSIFESGPMYRRKFIDWGLFYQTEHFLEVWRNFERVLKQRNAVLRDNRPKKELDPWTEELIKYGMELHSLRHDYLTAIQPLLLKLSTELLAIDDLHIQYQPGWNESIDYAQALRLHYMEEYRLGYTQNGPHRADFDVVTQRGSVKHFLSRGQQKLLICAMMIAQGRLLKIQGKKQPIYLVDDLPSELDVASRKKLLSLLADQETQIFITAIESETICNVISDTLAMPMKVFHVEHGHIIDQLD